MKELILVSHAQATNGSYTSERDRQLTISGIQSSYRTANFFRKHYQDLPQFWISSSVSRAVYTTIVFVRVFHPLPLLRIEEFLYTFSLEDLKTSILSLDDYLQNVIIFGHKRAFSDFVNDLGDTPVDNLAATAVALMHFKINRWKDLSERGHLKKLIKPKYIV
ncbi:SixA phosphatase family protein [Bacteroidetes bacterium endosymbiont of Geopemphigus sp.]|uniref:SixA phosphatase family protein n=1 Tax=Bacteroidetes bacterium endosymbiont of Geopemphigus sp. TaxID=2047937 RepID=UPI000CD10079|nr:histidine phosphatase family protein [Bacteroidetes bacterium endosymbiont of Geopemphigus sp.]